MYKMPLIYILECEQNKYYIGQTFSPIENSILEHFNNCGS